MDPSFKKEHWLEDHSISKSPPGLNQSWALHLKASVIIKLLKCPFKSIGKKKTEMFIRKSFWSLTIISGILEDLNRLQFFLCRGAWASNCFPLINTHARKFYSEILHLKVILTFHFLLTYLSGSEGEKAG